MSDIKVGKIYTATRPAEDWGIIDDKEVSFDEKVIIVKVLSKPKEVVCDDDSIIPLPKHLNSEEWYYVNNIEIGREHWISTVVYDFQEVTG